MLADDIGTFSLVDPKEFGELRTLFEDDLAADLHVIRTDLNALEGWLGSPPSDASSENIWFKLLEWDQARQWLEAYQAELARKQKIAELKAELAQMEEERASAESHSDMGLMDQWEEDILNQLDALEGGGEESCGCCYRR